TGQHPISADTFGMLMVRICTVPAPDVRSMRPDVPAGLADLINRMLSKDRKGRPASCAEVRATLIPWENHTSDESGTGLEPTLFHEIPRAEGNLVNPVTGTPALDVSTVLPVLPAAASAPAPAAAPAPASAPASAPAPAAAPAPASAPAMTSPSESREPERVVAQPAPSRRGLDASTVSPVERPTAVPPAPGNRGLLAGLAMGAVLVLAGAGAAVMLTRQGNRGEGDGRAAGAVVAPPAVPATVPVANPQTPVAAQLQAPVADRTVRIHVTTQPPGAELYLDNHRISNPFNAAIPQSDRVASLEARRAGYRSVIMDLVPSFEQEVVIPLERGTGVVDRRRSPTAAVAVQAGGAPVIAPSTASALQPEAQSQPHAATQVAPPTAPPTGVENPPVAAHAPPPAVAAPVAPPAVTRSPTPAEHVLGPPAAPRVEDPF
ncbi:MAG: hypothetical protein WCJ30_28645, partial [Deltaproteobacteria bacterium]